jgi:hypothetical protein
MDVIEIQTLIDITDSKINRSRVNFEKEHQQYRNFTTLKQCVELRSIIRYNTDPVCEIKDLKGLEFGTKYKGKQKVWTFRFSPDRSGVYNDGTFEIGHLLNDLHEIPIIQNLTETINMTKAILDLKDGENKNTIIKAIKGTI